MLMSPLEEVFFEVKRVLRERGIFAAVVDGIGYSNPLYDQFCKMLDDKIRKELPVYPENGFADVRLYSMDKLADLLSGILGSHRTIRKKDYDVEFVGTPSAVIEHVLRFFYSAYLLTDESRCALFYEAKAMIQSAFPESPIVTFPAPHTLIAVEQG